MMKFSAQAFHRTPEQNRVKPKLKLTTLTLNLVASQGLN